MRKENAGFAGGFHPAVEAAAGTQSSPGTAASLAQLIFADT